MPEDMDQAIDRLRKAYEAFNRGDFDESAEFVHPDILWNRVAEFESPLQGREAVRANMEPDVCSEQQGSINQVEVVADCVLALVNFSAKGAGSGIEMEDEAWHLWRIKDGLAIEFRYFDSRDEAVEAARNP